MKYRLSKAASKDLDHIVVYTLQRWGETQADRYFAELQDGFDLIASMPQIGKLIQGAGTTRRFEKGSHVIFYRETRGSIFVQRVLHRNMVPGRHEIEKT